MAESFSSALRLGGLDDYLNPAQECVLPLLKPSNQSEKDAASNTTETVGAVAPRVRPARAAARRRAQQRTENANPEAPGAAAAASATPPQGEAAPAPAPTEASTTSPISPREEAQAPVAAPSSDEAVSRVGKISLSDCLSCSGCLTSAEGILLNQQSAEEFFSLLSRKQRRNANIPQQQQKQVQIQHEKAPKIVAISLSSQCIAAVALEFCCSPTVAAERLSSLFRLLGADFVFSMAAAESLVLLESQKEFVGRLYQHQKSIGELGMEWKQPATDAAVLETVMEALLSSSGPLPLITSYCPGLVLYAEKNFEAPLLSFLSRVRSPQQIQGLLCKSAVRGTVEAVSFLLALKAHAWPGSAAGAGWGQAVTSTKPRRRVNAPWDLLRILLARSPYACYASDLGTGDDGAAAAAPGDVCAERLIGAAQGDGSQVSAAIEAPLTDSLAADAASATARTSTAEVGVVDAAMSERQSEGLSPEEVLHVCVMPCFDKKLEAARPDFRHSQDQGHKEQEGSDRNPDFSSFVASPLAFGAPREPWAEVDMVLATSELPQLLQAAGVSFDSLPSSPLDCLVPGTALHLVAHSLRCAAAASSRSAEKTAARCHQSSNSQTAEAPYDAGDALIIASACAAEEGAAMADEAAKALPLLSSLHVHERRQYKGVTTEAARPAAVLAGSGGYLEFIFLQTARGLFGRDLSPEHLEFIRGPNAELQSLAVLPQSQATTAGTAKAQEATGRSRGRRRGLWSDTAPALLRGAFAYGFRNIQNVVQQLRLLLSSENPDPQANIPAINGEGSETGTLCGYTLGIRDIGSSIPHIFEVGACPGGCLNGGGQTIKMDPVKVQGSSYSRNFASDGFAGCSQDRPVPEGSIRAYEPKIIGNNREPLASLTRLLHSEFPLISPQVHPLVAPAYAFLFGCCYGKEGGSAAAAALGEFESLLQQTEATKVLQDFLCRGSSSFLPARFWLAPRVTAVFRTDFRPAAASTKSSAFVSISDLKW